MLSLIAGLALLSAEKAIDLPEPSGQSLARITLSEKPLDPPKRTPRPVGNGQEEMPWLTEASARREITDLFQPKFDVFSPTQSDLNGQVARMLARLWQLLNRRWRYDNPSQYRNGVVDVYLCEGGSPGGEQFFGYDPMRKGPDLPVDVICIYDVKSFTKPLEMAREVAHEYGHAVLPPVGGFTDPEDWANGFLGERLFLRWMRDSMESKQLQAEDAMQVDFPALDGWVKSHVDPLVLSAATHAPDMALLHKQGPEAMAAYHALVLYADTLFPKTVAARSMLLTGSTHAWDYPNGLLMATQELDRFALNIPPMLRGKVLWVPLGKGKVSGATILKRQGDWAQIQPGTGAVQLFPATPG